jgi:pimeloyl-ACP methyl ester carboxylesterase
MNEAVVLVHGLWMGGFVMGFLSRELSARGYVTKSIGYPSMRREFRHNVALVRRAIEGLAAERVHLVGHSLGGLVALAALAGRSDPRIGRVVLLGSPVRGCQGGRQMAERAWGRPFLGTTAALWRDPPQLAAPAEVEVGVIAGTRRLGIGSIVLKLPAPNDGVVTVDETALPGLADHLVLAVSHSGMLVSREVGNQVAEFLRTGRFLR